MADGRFFSVSQRYGLAAFASGLAFLLAWWLQPLIGANFFPIFFSAVLISLWYGGLGPGLMATLVGVAGSACFFIIPVFTAGLSGMLARLGLFLLGAFLIGWLAVTRKRAEAARSESQYRLQALFNNTQDAILFADDRGQLVDANSAACALLGYTREQLLQLFAWDLIPGPSREPGLEVWPKFIAIGTYRGEGVVRRRDGTLVEAEHHVVANIAPGLHLAVLNDITVRKRAERAAYFLAEASRILASSLDYGTTLQRVARLAVPILADFCFVNIVEDGRLLDAIGVAATDQAKEQLAREARRRFSSDLSQMQYLPTVMQTGQPVLVSEINDALLVAVARDAEHLELLRQMGLVSFMIVPLVARGCALGVMIFMAAESSRHYGPADLALAEELAHRAALAVDNARLFDEARAAVRARDAFLAIASHEVKTPLATIKGYAELLQRHVAREGTLPARDERALQSIHEQSSRLQSLIESLFDVSLLQNSQLRLTREALDLGTLVHRLVEEIRPMLVEHSLELCALAEPLIVSGDKVRLEEVLQNLVNNAIKYSPHGGLVTVCLQRKGTQAILTVSDHGIGIPRETLPHLFTPFYRAAQSHVQGISGSGLGLFVAKEIVTLHGGTIAVESTEGEGSTFTISLPLMAEG